MLVSIQHTMLHKRYRFLDLQLRTMKQIYDYDPFDSQYLVRLQNRRKFLLEVELLKTEREYYNVVCRQITTVNWFFHSCKSQLEKELTNEKMKKNICSRLMNV